MSSEAYFVHGPFSLSLNHKEVGFKNSKHQEIWDNPKQNWKKNSLCHAQNSFQVHMSKTCQDTG